jgi:hypothetical protein
VALFAPINKSSLESKLLRITICNKQQISKAKKAEVLPPPPHRQCLNIAFPYYQSIVKSGGDAAAPILFITFRG